MGDILVIPRSHTIVEPLAMMIKVGHTLIAQPTMLGTCTPVGGKRKTVAGMKAHLLTLKNNTQDSLPSLGKP